MKAFPFSVSLVIPLYNNAKTLKSELNSCYKLIRNLSNMYEIIVINDASVDRSNDILKQYFSDKKNIKIYSHKTNQGIAKTILELYKKANYEYVVLFSIDGDWNPNDIDLLLQNIAQKKADIVIGKRNKKDYTFYRKTISFFYNVIPKLLFGVDTFDAGSIKVFKKKVFQKISITSTSLFFEAELLIKAQKMGYKITWAHVTYKKTHKTSGTAGKVQNVLHCLYDVVRVKARIQ